MENRGGGNPDEDGATQVPESFLWLVPLQRCSYNQPVLACSPRQYIDSSAAVRSSDDLTRLHVGLGFRINFLDSTSRYLRSTSIPTDDSNWPVDWGVPSHDTSERRGGNLCSTLHDAQLALPSTDNLSLLHARTALLAKESSVPPIRTTPHSISATEQPSAGSPWMANAILPISHYQIVLYRDRRMVVYNPGTRHLGVRALSSNEEATLRSLRLSHCPMCGQVIDPTRFSFEAQCYFRILQDILRSRMKFSGGRSESATAYAAPTTGYGWRHFLPDEGNDEPPEAAETTGSQRHSNPFVTEELRQRKEYPASGEGTSESDSASTKPVLTGMCITGYYGSFFREIRRLGSGSYGQVFLCHHLLDDVFLGEYAVKKVPVGQDRQWLQSMLREVKIRERLHNANIVEYKHSWLEMHRTSSHLPLIPWLFVLMEFCNGGDLDAFLTVNGYACDHSNCATRGRKTTGGVMFMKESHIWKLFLDIANGLNHLHHSGILHRDLKPQNILLQCTLDNLSQRPVTAALLSDFGTSELLADPTSERHGFTGTVEYTAPELLETDDKGHFREDYDEKSDIWSLGVVLFVMAYGDVPYFNQDPQRCRLEILTHTDPRLIIPSVPERSSDLILLIEALLQRDPRARPSLDTVLQHPRIRRRLADVGSLEEAGLEIAYLLGRSLGHPVSSPPTASAQTPDGTLPNMFSPYVPSSALEGTSPLVLPGWPNTMAESKQKKNFFSSS